VISRSRRKRRREGNRIQFLHQRSAAIAHKGARAPPGGGHWGKKGKTLLPRRRGRTLALRLGQQLVIRPRKRGEVLHASRCSLPKKKKILKRSWDESKHHSRKEAHFWRFPRTRLPTRGLSHSRRRKKKRACEDFKGGPQFRRKGNIRPAPQVKKKGKPSVRLKEGFNCPEEKGRPAMDGSDSSAEKKKGEGGEVISLPSQPRIETFSRLCQEGGGGGFDKRTSASSPKEDKGSRTNSRAQKKGGRTFSRRKACNAREPVLKDPRAWPMGKGEGGGEGEPHRNRGGKARDITLAQRRVRDRRVWRSARTKEVAKSSASSPRKEGRAKGCVY